MSITRNLRVAVSIATITVLGACSQLQSVYPDKRTGEHDTTPVWGDQKENTLFGPGGLALLGGDKKKGEEAGNGINVNAYLWRASLDTIDFIPLASADPFGGVIITDWYAPPESPTERFKMTVFIMDRTLRSDGVHVSVFRQVQNSAGEWADAPVEKKTAVDMENAILTRARELRTATASRKN